MNFDERSRKIIELMNTVPLDDFDGFSAQEMNAIIYSPFAKECPISVRSQITGDLLDRAPIFQIARYLFDLINDNKGLKLTSTGNLSPRVVTEIYDRKYVVDKWIEGGMTKLRQEKNWNILHCTKLVLKLSKLIRTYKGKLLLTTLAKDSIKNRQYSKLFLMFLETYTTRFNWAYNDAFQDEEIGQTGFLYLLHLINRYGIKYRELSFYTDLYFKAFPVFKEREKSFSGSRSEFVVGIRFLERFAEWFGFVEIHREQNNFTQPFRVRGTKLLSHLLV